MFLVLLICNACGIYSFQQGSIPPEVQTISISNIYDESGSGPPNLGQLFTEKLKGYYQQNSRLALVNTNGDWQLDGKVVSYQTTGVAPQGDGSAASRLTIRLQVKFVNTKDEKASFDQSFQFFADYGKDQTLNSVASELIETISNQIVFDVFTKTTSNW